MDMEIDKYINYCTVEQTNRAIKLGCPCDNPEDHNPVITPSTQAMFGWLREKKHIDIWVSHRYKDSYDAMLDGFIITREFSYWKAELSAINEALDYLETYEKR